MKEASSLEEARIIGAIKAFEELERDFNTCTEVYVQNPESQFWLRTSIHTFFALAEAVTYATKQCLLHECNIRRIELSPSEMAILKEESYELENNGVAYIKKAKLKTSDNFRFTFSLLYERMELNRQFNASGNGWQSYLKSLGVRDRLTHPKSLDVFVENDERVALAEAMRFLVENLFIVVEVTSKYYGTPTQQ